MQIAIAEIYVPNPTELTPDIEQQIREMADSIKENGLSHPIIVRTANGSFPPFILASGEKRLLAYKVLEKTHIEAEVRDIDETQAKIIRVHENLRRFNLPWWEASQLVEELHRLRQQEHGEGTSGRPKKGEEKPGWGIRDTAEELGVALGPLSEDLNLARAVRLDPSLRNVKDKKTAIRLVRIASQRKTAEVEAGIPSDLGNSVLFGDSAEILKQLPDHSIHHCITDPPWIKFFDPKLRLDERTLPVLKELYRVLKNNSFLYIVCGLDDYSYYVGADFPKKGNASELEHTEGQLEKIGFKVSKTPLLWEKVNSLSRRGVKSWEYDRDFEFIIVAVKGSPALTSSTSISGIKRFPVVPTARLIHPNEKPVDLISSIIDDCSYEGNIIVDPFAGSGVLGEAAKKKKRKYVLIERDRTAFEKIQKRLKDLK